MDDKNKLIRNIGIFLLYILVPYVLNVFLPSITSSSVLELTIRIACMFLLLLFFVFLNKDDIIRDIKAFKSNVLKIVLKSVMYFVILMVGFALISAILIAIYPKFQYTNSSIVQDILNKNLWFGIFYIFVICLFTEQIVFRKIFKDILHNKYFFVVFSGIIYGIFQVGYNIRTINDILTIIPFSFVGIILSVSYEKTDNIVTPCMVYFLYNLFNYVVDLLIAIF